MPCFAYNTSISFGNTWRNAYLQRRNSSNISVRICWKISENLKLLLECPCQNLAGSCSKIGHSTRTLKLSSILRALFSNSVLQVLACKTKNKKNVFTGSWHHTLETFQKLEAVEFQKWAESSSSILFLSYTENKSCNLLLQLFENEN